MTPEPLRGVAALADRPVDGRRVAIVMGLVAIALGGACLAMAEHLLATANDEPEVAAMLRALPPPPRASGPFGRAAVVLVDGMRVDESRRMRAFRLGGTIEGELALPLPTLSRPFYHQLFTGVPPDGSGVRSNRFDLPARFDSIADRVRAAHGRVIIVADGLPWMRRMIGRPGDGGSDAPGSIDAPLDRFLREWREARAPALLLVHVTKVDHTAHDEGIRGPHHRAELAHAERVVDRVAASAVGASLIVLSDHGHLERGGHGGPEPEVARSPLLIRAPSLGPAPPGPYAPSALAATISAALGVPAPRSAAYESITARLDPSIEGRRARVRFDRQLERAFLDERRRWAVLVAFFGIVMTLGPIKRAFAFDRSVLAAIVLWPAIVLGLHALLGLPLSLSAIDSTTRHTVRVVAIGLVAAMLAFVAARSIAKVGSSAERTRRAAASVGWIAWSSALACSTYVGFALGPWSLGPSETYVPLLVLGAASSALAAAGVALLASAARRG